MKGDYSQWGSSIIHEPFKPKTMFIWKLRHCQHAIQLQNNNKDNDDTTKNQWLILTAMIIPIIMMIMTMIIGYDNDNNNYNDGDTSEKNYDDMTMMIVRIWVIIMEMNKQFHRTYLNECNYLSMPGSKLVHVDPRSESADTIRKTRRVFDHRFFPKIINGLLTFGLELWIQCVM